MKKIISVLLLLCMTLSLFASAVPAADNYSYGYLVGDVDDDTAFDMKDLLAMRKFLLGILAEKDISVAGADVDNNGGVSMNDLLVLRKMMLGLEEVYELNGDKQYKVDTVTIGGRNISRYTIVYPEGNECMDYSTRHLRMYISGACGVVLNRTTDPSSVNGYKLQFVFDEANEYELGVEGYRLHLEEDGDLMVYCGSLRGPIYAMVHIIEEYLGWRFLSTNHESYSEASGYREYGYTEYLYAADNVDIPVGLDETVVPYFSYRDAGGAHDENFFKLHINDSKQAEAKYGWKVGTLFMHAHSFEAQLDMDMYTEQPCMTDEEIFQRILAFNINLVKDRATWERPQLLNETFTQVSCSPNDNTNFCQCATCKNVYEIEGSIAGTVFRLANRVAEAMYKEFPGVETYTIAYWDARNPPKMTRPHDYVCVGYCVGGCNNHAYDDTESCVRCGGNPRLTQPAGNNQTTVSSNEYEMPLLEAWAELTNNIQIWYYPVSVTYKMGPSPVLFNIYNDIKYLASLGCVGVYFECGGSTSFEPLKNYLATKMLWDPFMSEEEFNNHLNEYLFIYYGEGWENIRKIIDMTNYAGDLQGCWTNNFDRPWNMYNEEYFKDNYLYMAELVDAAIEEAEEGVQKYRIMTSMLHVHFLGLSATYERDYVNGDSTAREKYVERYTDLYNNIVTHGVRITGLSGNEFDRYGCSNMPSSANEVINPMTWIFDDFTGYWVRSGTGWV